MGGGKFVIIGNFLDDADTPFDQPASTESGAYFLDDIRLTPISKPNAVNELDVGFAIAPNPASEILRIDYTGNLTPTAVRLLTVEGRRTLTAPWSGTVDVSGLADGLYLLQMEFSNGAVGTELVIITH